MSLCWVSLCWGRELGLVLFLVYSDSPVFYKIFQKIQFFVSNCFFENHSTVYFDQTLDHSETKMFLKISSKIEKLFFLSKLESTCTKNVTFRGNRKQWQGKTWLATIISVLTWNDLKMILQNCQILREKMTSLWPSKT